MTNIFYFYIKNNLQDRLTEQFCQILTKSFVIFKNFKRFLKKNQNQLVALVCPFIIRNEFLNCSVILTDFLSLYLAGSLAIVSLCCLIHCWNIIICTNIYFLVLQCGIERGFLQYLCWLLYMRFCMSRKRLPTHWQRIECCKPLTIPFSRWVLVWKSILVLSPHWSWKNAY